MTIVPILAAINAQDMVQSLVWIVVCGIIFWLLWWLLSYCAIPEPFNKVARVILALVAVIILINFLLGFAGHQFINWR